MQRGVLVTAVLRRPPCAAYPANRYCYCVGIGRHFLSLSSTSRSTSPCTEIDGAPPRTLADYRRWPFICLTKTPLAGLCGDGRLARPAERSSTAAGGHATPDFAANVLTSFRQTSAAFRS